jgi:hypothetical protein
MSSPSHKKTCERIAVKRFIFQEFANQDLKLKTNTSANVPSPAGTTK